MNDRTPGREPQHASWIPQTDVEDEADVHPAAMSREANARLAHSLGIDATRYRVLSVEVAFLCLRRIGALGAMERSFWVPRQFGPPEPYALRTRVGVLVSDPTQGGLYAAIPMHEEGTSRVLYQIPSRPQRMGESQAQAAARALFEAGLTTELGERLLDEVHAFSSGSERVVVFHAECRLPWRGLHPDDLRHGPLAFLLDTALDRLAALKGATK
jgi:hypothetical protein